MFRSHYSMLPHSKKICSFIGAGTVWIIWKLWEKMRDGDWCSIMIFNCERTHSCFMCDRLWRLRVWTQLIVVIQYSIRKSCYLPVSIHDCYCVAWSLHINGRWCVCTHPLNVIALTSGAYVTFPVVVPVLFCISRVTDLHPREGDM